jgi:hypothetical protein
VPAQQPDDVVFVMDSSIGQAARDQAQAFKDAVAVGAFSVDLFELPFRRAPSHPATRVAWQDP